jgi:hypothetical protein
MQGVLPVGVNPRLGPDATAMGQIYAFTLQGPRDIEKKRFVLDQIVSPALRAVPGVAEVAPAGGVVREYQIDVDPTRLAEQGITLDMLMMAVQQAGRDVGAMSVEQTGVETMIRGVGFVRSVRDVRVSMPAAPGFLRALRLAASLGLPVRLLPGQPSAEALGYMPRDQPAMGRTSSLAPICCSAFNKLANSPRVRPCRIASSTLLDTISGAAAERVAANTAESMYASYRMARLGIIVMDLCRPIPFRELVQAPSCRIALTCPGGPIERTGTEIHSYDLPHGGLFRRRQTRSRAR